MKNKIICLFILVFSVSFFSSAKKFKPCSAAASVQSNQQKSSEIKSTSVERDDDFDVPALGNIFLVI